MYNVICEFRRLEYEQRRDMEAPVQKLLDLIGATKDQLATLQAKEAELKDAVEAITGQLNDMKAMHDGMQLAFLRLPVGQPKV